MKPVMAAEPLKPIEPSERDAKRKAWSRKVVVASTALLLLWPLAQIALVEVFDTNPWRLMGFGMYTTAHEVRVTLRRQVAGGPPVEVAPRDLPPPARAAYDDFLARRAVLGRLCSPAPFVTTWRGADPGLGVVELDIEVLRLKGGRLTTIARDHLSL